MAKQARAQAYRFGLLAEKLAAWYLRCKGYRIVAERYRNHHGEIDLVAQRGNMLVAVEVKARKRLADCSDSITAQKRQRVARAMQGMLAAGQNRDIRFDVIWIVPWHWPRHIQDAWRL